MAKSDDFAFEYRIFYCWNWKFNKKNRINIIENWFSFDCVGKTCLWAQQKKSFTCSQHFQLQTKFPCWQLERVEHITSLPFIHTWICIITMDVVSWWRLEGKWSIKLRNRCKCEINRDHCACNVYCRRNEKNTHTFQHFSILASRSADNKF